MPFLKVTAKRQATLPKETCEDLGLRPGDVINLERRSEKGETVWILRPKTVQPRKWVARLAGRVNDVTDHSMEAVRESIAAGRKRGE